MLIRDDRGGGYGRDVSIGVPLPPDIEFGAAPDLVVLPDTDDVYVAPDIDADLYFWDGWWWRLWEGRWYRSSYYDRGWAYYNGVPNFYYDVHPDWRRYYKDRHWDGHQWDYQRIPNRDVQHDWKRWHNDRYWERQKTWGVQNYQPLPEQKRQEMRHYREEQYSHRPEVQRHQRESGTERERTHERD